MTAFLIVHGAWMWKVALAAFVALGVGGVVLVRHVRKRPRRVRSWQTLAWALAFAVVGYGVLHKLGTVGIAADVIAIAPLVTRDRDALATAVARFVPVHRKLEGVPFELLDAAVVQRDLARATGDAASAMRWQAIIDRHAAVLADRDRLIALLLWRSMRPTR